MNGETKDIIEVLVAKGYDEAAIVRFAQDVTKSWDSDMEFSYEAAMKKRAIEERIREAFDELSIPTHLEGYEHVVKAVEYAYDNPKKLGDIRFLFFYSNVARYIGRLFNTEVKRDVRRAIRYIKRYSRKETQKKYFGSYTSIWRMSDRTFFRELIYYFKVFYTKEN